MNSNKSSRRVNNHVARVGRIVKWVGAVASIAPSLFLASVMGTLFDEGENATVNFGTITAIAEDAARLPAVGILLNENLDGGSINSRTILATGINAIGEADAIGKQVLRLNSKAGLRWSF